MILSEILLIREVRRLATTTGNHAGENDGIHLLKGLKRAHRHFPTSMPIGRKFIPLRLSLLQPLLEELPTESSPFSVFHWWSLVFMPDSFSIQQRGSLDLFSVLMKRRSKAMLLKTIPRLFKRPEL